MADPLKDEVDKATRKARFERPGRVSPLSEFSSLGPNWHGRTGLGRDTEQFRRDKRISDAASAADDEDRVSGYAKGGRVKAGTDTDCGPMCRDTKTIR